MIIYEVIAHLEHLSCADDRLSRNVTLGNHHLLCHENLAGRDLDTKITSSDHDTVCFLEYFVKIDDTLLVFDLHDYLNASSFLPKHLADVPDIVGRADKRREDHVNPIFDTKGEVFLVLLGKGREVDRRFR